MKRLIGPMILLVLVSLAPVLAQQEQQKQPEKQPMGQMGMMHQMMPGMMQGDMQARMHGSGSGPMGLPKLTEEQQTKLQDLRLAHEKEVLPLRAELEKQRVNLKLELTADKFNESKAKSIEGEISKLTSEIASKMVQHLRAVRDLLTPEQKKVFDQHILSGGPMGPGGMMGQGMMRGGGMTGHAGMMGHGGMMGPAAGDVGPHGPGVCNCMK